MVVKHKGRLEGEFTLKNIIWISMLTGVTVATITWVLSGFGLTRTFIGPLILGLFIALSMPTVLKFLVAMIEPDHLKAAYSHQTFEIANATLPHLRTGLNERSAEEVAKILKGGSDAVAVALTNLSTVLAFSGAGEDHHMAGQPIMTRATKEALKHNELRILSSKDEIGCPKEGCVLSSAIVVPLELKDRAIGSLKFYYADAKELTESRITLAAGLAKLLSTQLELSELDRQEQLACKAELKALQAQINPHFLFNTLNTIASLCRTDPKKARILIIQFADFFRQSLERESDLITLADELDYVRSYLILEKARFGQNLQVIEEIDEAALGVRIPALTIQPLVENSIKHGGSMEGHIKIKIEAKVKGGEVAVIVRDNGQGIEKGDLKEILTPGFGKGMGIGLSNVSERVKGFYGEDYPLDVWSVKDKGTRITIRIPLSGRQVEAKSAYS
ncbi:MAG: histidine kinase [Actinomycetota bacterium]|nr:histidine kinase [Actinomycetota bacterium]